MKRFFGTSGILRDHLPHFEFREQQLMMADFIRERLLYRENGLIEAGTGIGKTMAYLVPSIIYAVENDKKIAVSTETKALQKQLVDKDIPVVRDALSSLGYDFSFSLCLGSSNYPCKRRFEAIVKSGRFSKPDAVSVEDIGRLFSRKKVFSRYDVTSTNSFWNSICREPDSCNSFTCHFQNGCVYQKAKKEWASSRLLIINHYLFYTNIASAKTYLPDFDLVVFDESHALEHIGASQLGFEISRDGLSEILAVFSKRHKHDLLPFLGSISSQKKAIDLINRVEMEAARFFEYLYPRLKKTSSTRLMDPLPEGEALLSVIRSLLDLLDPSTRSIEDDLIRLDLEIAQGKLFSFHRNLQSVVFRENEEHVYWIEKSDAASIGNIVIKSQPLSISDIMLQEVNGYYESALYTSATLSVNGDFSYIADSLGISRYQSLMLDSPFDYKNNVFLYMDRTSVQPDSDEYARHIAEASATIINIVKGNCLILFTSYRLMKEVCDILAALIPYRIYRQGDHSVTEVLSRYIEDEGSVLMGTNSFWQGIDLPGDVLRGVIITRLPFSVPDYPPFQARSEKMAAMGKNPFYSIQIPDAVIRFKQGFGRLIRRSTDRGIIAVLDSRLHHKGYGKLFIQSLPECTVVTSIQDIAVRYSTTGKE